MPWTERVMNEEVLDKIKDKRQLWKSIQSKTILNRGIHYT